MRFLGQSSKGIYVEDPLHDVHPELLEQYYGVDGHWRRAPHQTGAGHPEDEDGHEVDADVDPAELLNDQNATIEDLENRIADAQSTNIRHEPIKVARHASPFTTEEAEIEFWTIVEDVVKSHVLPDDFGVQPDEWGPGGYPHRASIKVGAKAKAFEVDLPIDIWLPRAIRWTQALDIMIRLQLHTEEHT